MGALAAAAVVVLGGSVIATAMYDRTTPVPAVPVTPDRADRPTDPQHCGDRAGGRRAGHRTRIARSGPLGPGRADSGPATAGRRRRRSRLVPSAIARPNRAARHPPAPSPEPAAPPTPTPDAPGAVGGPAVVVTLDPTSASGGNALGSWPTPTAD